MHLQWMGNCDLTYRNWLLWIFFFRCETLNYVISFVAIIYIFFITCKPFQVWYIFWIKETHGSFIVKHVKNFTVMIFTFSVTERRWIYFLKNLYFIVYLIFSSCLVQFFLSPSQKHRVPSKQSQFRVEWWGYFHSSISPRNFDI